MLTKIISGGQTGAQKAIGPRQLTEDEARDTARRAYTKNTSLRSVDIGKAIGRSRQTVDSYIADLRAATQLGLDIKIFRMHGLGVPQDRIAKRLGLVRTSLHNHLLKMPVLANSINTDLSRGFTVSQVAEKHNWAEPMVWSLALDGKEDLERFKELGWGLRTWDLWNWNDCDKRFGDDWQVAGAPFFRTLSAQCCIGDAEKGDTGCNQQIPYHVKEKIRWGSLC